MANDSKNPQHAQTAAPTAATPAPAVEKIDPAVARLAERLKGVKAEKGEHPCDVALRVIDELAKSNKALVAEVEAAKKSVASAAAELEKARASGGAGGPVKTRFMKS